MSTFQAFKFQRYGKTWRSFENERLARARAENIKNLVISIAMTIAIALGVALAIWEFWLLSRLGEGIL